MDVRWAELARLLVKLFNQIGSGLDAEQVDSLHSPLVSADSRSCACRRSDGTIRAFLPGALLSVDFD